VVGCKTTRTDLSELSKVREFAQVRLATWVRWLMAMLAIAVANLDEMDDLTPSVAELGRRHAGYGASDEDYKWIGEALIWTLEQGLRDEFTPAVKSAWLATYELLSGTMRAAANDLQPVRRGFIAPLFGRRAA
jgi:hemoglobin-like flavoprotein